MGLISGFDWPVRSSIFPQFIDNKSQMMSAVALNAMLWQGLRILAPASGGFLIAYLGTHSVFFISSFLLFLITFNIIGIMVRDSMIGDIADHDHTSKHEPIVTSQEDCVCVIATDGPLIFNSFIANIFQSIARI